MVTLTLGFLGDQYQIGQRSPRVLADDRNSIGVTAERRNVLLGPAQCCDYVQHAQIARWIAGACLEEAFRGRGRLKREIRLFLGC